MSNILDWIFEGIANWVASIVTSVMDAISGVFLNALGTDMTAMEEYFPFAAKAFEVFQYTAWALLFLITIWQLFRTFGGPITEAESPWTLLARSTIFAILIGFAKPIFMLTLNIARAPYTALMDTTMTASDFTFAGVWNVLGSALVTLIGTLTIVGLILQLILQISLGWNYFKLLLEVVERYIVVGVLCYTSPLAFAMGGSKATNQVFKSWCRMVGSQLLLLCLNVWFLRAFNSSVGHFVANHGALTTGHGNIFLWMFCALAFLKTAQKFDSYLAAMGLNVAQTGSSMGMEMLMAARMIGGFGGGPRSVGSFFRGGAAAAGGVAGAAGAAGGFMSGFTSRFKPNSYVRDAVVEGGSKMGAGGGIGFVGRTFGGMAARNGAVLNGDSISSVAARAPQYSGSIAGDIADRSLQNYMPHMAGQDLSNTQIAGGKISTTATMADGKEASVEMFNASQYDRPDMPHSVVSASDGSQWYQIATGEGASGFYETPQFSGDMSESADVASAFPGVQEGTMLRTTDEGALEATYPDGSSSMWYSSAHYDEPDAPHETFTDSNGMSWYGMTPQAETPQFESGDNIAIGSESGSISGAAYDNLSESGAISGTEYSNISESGRISGAEYNNTSESGSGGTSINDAAVAYNNAQFQNFMPGYEQQISQVNASRADEGMLEVRHADGTGTAFYDRTQFDSPRGDYKVYEDSKGGQWYAIQGHPTVERQPVYQDGKPVYDGQNLRTTNVEMMRYKTTPNRYEKPAKRDPNDRKPPRRKQ